MTKINSVKQIILDDRYGPISEKLRYIFSRMDLMYKSVSEYYGFKCTSCQNNCCLSTFHHHTFIEYLCVMEGFNTLSIKRQHDIEKRAMSIQNKFDHRSNSRIMCPLNLDNKCIIYEYRPMVCRLHGIPHELYYPNPSNTVIIGPGCHKFEVEVTKTNNLRLDRTPIYKEIISLESKTRKIFDLRTKLKITIADMIKNRHHLK